MTGRQRALAITVCLDSSSKLQHQVDTGCDWQYVGCSTFGEETCFYWSGQLTTQAQAEAAIREYYRLRAQPIQVTVINWDR